MSRSCPTMVVTMTANIKRKRKSAKLTQTLELRALELALGFDLRATKGLGFALLGLSRHCKL